MPSKAVTGRADLTDAQWGHSGDAAACREEVRPPAEVDQTQMVSSSASHGLGHGPSLLISSVMCGPMVGSPKTSS